ncbi:hypothetical protein ACR82Z_01215 [Mycoplasma sp. 6243]|uniref:hypothetical protein n=1 Tax=Mycoplasma sp. 6243 TaxID=3440865 RepID=UPI003EB6D1AA
MKKSKLFNSLGLKFIEFLPSNHITLEKKLKIWKLILILSFYLISLLFCALYVSKILPNWLQWTYLYTYGLLFGNSIFFALLFGFLAILVWIFTLFTKKKAISWTSRVNKIDFVAFKNWMLKILLFLFLFFVILTHLILHYIYNHDVEFNTKLPAHIFKNGWYAKFMTSKQKVTIEDISIYNNVGVVFDTLINLFYLPTLSSLLVILLLIGIVVFLCLYILDIKLIIKKNKWNIQQYKKFINSHKSFYLSTTHFEKYLDFLFKAAKFYDIDYKKTSFKLLEKSIISRVDEQIANQLLKNAVETSIIQQQQNDDFLDELDKLDFN